jgi:site-specific DNA-cytosine methylase
MRSSQQGADGQTRVLLMAPKEQSRGEFSTPNISEWPNDAAVCSLSQVLEQTSIPQRFFLSSTACAGILRRAEKRGKQLPEPLRLALQAVVGATAPTTPQPGTCSLSPCASTRGGMGRLDAESETLLPINIYGGNKRSDRPEGGFYVRMGEDTSKTLDAATGLNPTCSQGGTAVLSPIALQDVTPREKAQNGKGWNDDGVSYTVDAAATQGVANSMQVRRLTPTECERLQGFPDGYTNIKDKCPDGPRYKVLGNSWAVPVVRWIGERINAMG